MRFAAIGRSQVLFNSIEHLLEMGHNLVGVITDVGAAEYSRQIIDFEKIAIRNQVPFLVTSLSGEIDEFLRNIDDLDIGLSVNHRRVIEKSTINFFKYGILNLHGGDLPKYRGNACQAWAIINGEIRIGACVYKIQADALDAGKILSREYFELSHETKIGTCLNWIETVSPKMFAKAFSLLEENPEFFLEDTSKDMQKGFRCHERRPIDGYINWNQEPDEIVRLINASGPPFFGAFSFLNGEIIKIYDASVGEKIESFYAVPGQVIMIGEDFARIACGQKGGHIKVVSLQDSSDVSSISKVLKSTRSRLGPKITIVNQLMEST